MRIQIGGISLFILQNRWAGSFFFLSLFFFCFAYFLLPLLFYHSGPQHQNWEATDGSGLRAEKPGDRQPRKLSYVTQVILPEPQLPSRQNVKQLGTQSSCSERLWALSEHHKQNARVSAEITSWPPPPCFPCCGPGFLFQHLFLVLPKPSVRGSGTPWSLQAKMPGQGRSRYSLRLFSGMRGSLNHSLRYWCRARAQRERTCPAGALSSQSPTARKGGQGAPFVPCQAGPEGRTCPASGKEPSVAAETLQHL